MPMPDLLHEIQDSVCDWPAIWWLGHSGFVLKYRNAIIYIDPVLSSNAAPFQAADVTHAGLILCTHRGRVDPDTIRPMLEASPRSRLVIPKSVAGPANEMGIPFNRMVTTDSGLRVEYLDDRIYAVPSAHDKLDWTPLGGYPYLGYLVRFGGLTIYHSGDCVPYEDLAKRLRPYSVTVALLPIGGRPHNFEIAEADFTKLFSPLNPDNLPHAKDAQGHCLPVYPHDFIKVNTVFEVIRGAGGHTAWSDKHPAYDLVNGPSGTGVEDLYTPEINSPIANGGTRQWRQPEGDARPVRRDDQLAAAEQGRRLHHLRARGHGL